MSIETNSSQVVFHQGCFAMGTRLNVVITEKDKDYAYYVFKAIIDEVRRLDAKLNRFSTSSEIFKINYSANQQPVKVDLELYEILSLCRDYYHRTDGLFDITINPQWEHFVKPAPKIFDKPNCFNIVLDETKKEITFLDSETQIDLGGFGKGYALDRIRIILKESKVENAIVSFGESSILALGHHPYGDCWKLGIEHAYKPSKPVYVFDLSNEGFSTSGFQRMATGHQNAIFHVISPITGLPVRRMSTITVKSKDCVEAEILSTALYACEAKEPRFLENFTDCEIIEIEYKEKEVAQVIKHGQYVLN